MEIFKLFGSIMIKSDEADQSLQKTDSKVKAFGEKLGNGIKTAAKWGAAVVAAATAVGAGMMAAANKTAEAADEIDKASRRAGTDAENWQRLEYAFGQCGISASTLEKSMIKNQQALNKAAEGTAAYAEAYEKLGVSINDTDGNLRDADDVFNDTIRALADLEDVNERNAVANQLFGKSYAELAPLLDAGSAGIDELTSRADQLGLVLSQETVDAGVKFGDTLADARDMLGHFGLAIGGEFLPILQGMLDFIIDHAPEIQEVVHGVVEFIQTAVQALQDFWDEHGEAISEAVGAVFEVIKTAISVAMEVISGIIKAVTAVMEGDWDSFWDAVVDIVMAIGTALFDAGKAIFGKLWDGIKSVWQGISDWVGEKVNWIKDKVMFWKKSQDDMSDNSSSSSTSTARGHASGLAYVPFDNYPALLHRGEGVVNANNMNNLATQIIAGVSTLIGAQGAAPAQPIVLQVNLDSRQIAEGIYNPLKDISYRRGTVYG